MGNIGYSQGLTALIRAFETAVELTDQAVIRVTGTGVAADEARAEIRDDRVQMLGTGRRRADSSGSSAKPTSDS